MTARENLQVQLKRVCGEYGEDLDFKFLLQVAQVGIHFFISAVLAGGILFGVSSPLAVALVGASGAGLSGGAALLGAAFGYLSLHSFSLGLRYLSAAILSFAFSFCFYDLKWIGKPWFMAGLTGFVSALTGYFYLSYGGWTPSEVVFYLAELLITVVCTWAFSLAFLPIRFEAQRLTLDLLEQRIAMVISGCALLVSLSGLMLWGDVSLGRIFAVVVILGFAWREGAGAGAILGVCCGCAIDLAVFNHAIYAMSWGFSAMCGGFFKDKPRLHCSLAFLLANGTTVLWCFGDGSSGGILYEVFLGTLIFQGLPLSWLSLCHVPSLQSEEDLVSQILQKEDMERVRKQLQASALAFGKLGETLKTAFRPPRNEQDLAVIFDRTAQKVCQKCQLCQVCWEKDYVSTLNAMNDASNAMMARGKAMPQDFPPYFSHRCLHFPPFLEEVNQQLNALLYRRQYHNRVRESRVAVCHQYQQLSTLLEQASQQISQELSPQVKKAKELRNYLAYLGMEAKVTLLVNGEGMLQGEICGAESLEALESHQAVEELSKLLQAPIRLTPIEGGLALRQLEPFMAVAGFASAKKEGEKVCGDKSVYFKREDGKLFVLICDGMGSGTEALGESTLATELLEQFLKAGIDTLQALTILNSALALRGEEGGGFTTVDLLELNLVTAQGMLYKYGAAPTYFRRGKEVRRIVGSTMPAGVDYGTQSLPDQIKLSLEPEDCLLLVSDGISGAVEEDLWLCETFAQKTGENMKEFARSLLEETPNGGKDDRTAVAVKLTLRQE